MCSDGSAADIACLALELSRRASGDIIYACKPLLTSFLPALLASGFGRKKTLLLDVEDNDVWGPYGADSVSGWFNLYVRGFRSATAAKYGILLHPFYRCCKAVSVSTRPLQRIYGGALLRHGPDSHMFDPLRPALDPTIARRRFGIPENEIVVLFAGTPQAHKGFDIIVDALEYPGSSVHLMLCGNPRHPDFLAAKHRLRERCHCTGYVENSDMPQALAAADIVPILQKRCAYTRAQLPAKMLEAMAMKKIVVTSDVGDLPEIMGAGGSEPRGWVISEFTADSFNRVLGEIKALPTGQVRKRTRAAREYFLEEASIEANMKKLVQDPFPFADLNQ